jgi:hypothetical protein
MPTGSLSKPSVFLSLLASVAFAVSVGACGGDEDGHDSDKNVSGEEPTETSESAFEGGHFSAGDFPSLPRKTCNGAFCINESGKIEPNPDWPARPRSKREDRDF